MPPALPGDLAQADPSAWADYQGELDAWDGLAGDGLISDGLGSDGLGSDGLGSDGLGTDSAIGDSRGATA